MSPSIERFRIGKARTPYGRVAGTVNAKLNIAVIFTTIESTLSALRMAGTLANRLRARITLIVPQVVPYPLPLNRPPVPTGFTERHFRVITAEIPVETNVRVYPCRDRMEALRGVLKPNSLVVVGGNRSWWPTREKRLARQLRECGHEVVFADTIGR